LSPIKYVREHGRVTIGETVTLTGTSRNTLKQHSPNYWSRGTWSCTAAVTVPDTLWHSATNSQQREQRERRVSTAAISWKSEPSKRKL